MSKNLFCLFLVLTPLQAADDLLVLPPLQAADDLFRERFADPATRPAALRELIPGTREAFFFTALHHQLAGHDAAFRKTLVTWHAAAGRKADPVSASGLATLENRQLLLDYQAHPKDSLAKLIERLDLTFDDARPDAAAAAESLPTRLDPALIATAAFDAAALAASPRTPYTQFSGERLLRELSQVDTFDDAKTRWFLQHLKHPEHPGVVPLIARAFNLEHPVAFAALEFRDNLTSGQLAALLKLEPGLLASETFAITYLTKLRPGAETDLGRDPKALVEHLRNCRDFAITLPPSQNSLKAHVLFHHLRLQAEIGHYAKDDFLAFLALPRAFNPLFITRVDLSEAPCVNPKRDFAAVTGCPPVTDDTALIELLLSQFLSQTDSAKAFAPFIREASLTEIHARARLLDGAESPRWGTVLEPAAFKQLQQEARISFAPGTPQVLAATDPVKLTLDLKNTPDVLLRIYEIDLPAHLARHGREPDVAIDLDGLVPHHQRHLTYQQAPILLHREAIDLPELSGPGVWLVDLVSGQVAARALIRKGNLIPYLERTATGQALRVFDENAHPLAAATLTLGSESFTADATGRITIPNAPNKPATAGLVSTGKLAAPITLGPREDQPALDARFHLEREQLLADQATQVQLRLRLTNHGCDLPLERLENPALVLTAKLLGDLTTERIIAENLALAPTLSVPFQVPADLRSLTLTLRGTFTPATGGVPIKLSADATYQINADLEQATIATAFFSPTASGYRLEVRGRNGEPLPSRAITLKCEKAGYQPAVTLQARTDAQGRIDLGKLDSIATLTASGTDLADTPLRCKPRSLECAPRIQLPAATELRLPLEIPATAPDPNRLSLLETLDGKPVRDHFDKLSIAAGQLVIHDLPPGDFLLRQGAGTTRIRCSSGVEQAGLLISPTRVMPRLTPPHPSIAKATAENGQVTIQLRDASPHTRLTLAGKRYQHRDWNPGSAAFPFRPPQADTLAPGLQSCGFLTERRLSDEMRYILERRAAVTFPGSLLPRPGLLLNRWTEEDLEQAEPSGRDAEGGIPSAMMKRKPGSQPAPPDDRGSNKTTLAAACDFLKTPAVVRFDLTPKPDGTLSLPLADFAGCQFIEIIAADEFASDALQLPLPANDTALRERRLARPLDPAIHYLATRNAAVLTKGKDATIENLLDADWRAFTTLTEAHQLLHGFTASDILREFTFLTMWPDLTENQKLDLLAKHACHELHLFLARKDQAFFDKHVKPLLAAKLEPQFIDDLLLGRDLSTYLRPYAWQRLNAAEKALLAQAVPAARDTIATELKLRWQTEAPAPEAETTLFTQTLGGSDLSGKDSLGIARKELRDEGAMVSSGVPYIQEKLKRIIIPNIAFDDITVDEAVDFLRLRAAELDTLETDPTRKGMNFLVRKPTTTGDSAGLDAAAESGGLSAGGSPGARRINLRLTNVPIGQALKYICEAANLRYKTDDYAVSIVPMTECGSDIFTRTFRMPPGFIDTLQTASAGSGEDPFAAGDGTSKGLTTRRPPIDLLKKCGIVFGEGSSVTLTPDGNLLVTNTAAEMDKIEQLTTSMRCAAPPSPGTEPPARGFKDDDSTLAMGGLGSEGAADPFAAPEASPKALKALRLNPLFPDRTRLYREANYYGFSGITDESLIALNRFWLDLAAWDGKGPFLSPHFNACCRNAHEALLCLAVLDLPFKAERPEVTVDGSTLRVKAREPMLLFYKDTRRSDQVAAESPLLVRESFCPLDEPYRTVEGRKVENPITGDFEPGVPYSASLIVTNPTGTERQLDVLAQIPAGAIPLAGKPATLAVTQKIAPYGVLTLDLAFYFPAAGEFPVYPMHVTEHGVILAHSGQRVLHVTAQPAPEDNASWSVLARDGSTEEVLKRLRTENLGSIDLTEILWRLKDREVYLKITQVLRERLHFSPAVFAYAFHHDDPATIRTYLENSESVTALGPWLDSPLLTVRPRIHHDWETLEFDPLINPRAHAFGDQPRLTHPDALKHYDAFLDQLAWKPALDATDELTLTVLLLLQDRLEEALERFAKIDPAKLPARLNYDYLRAVMLFHQEQPAAARAIAATALPGLPPGLWHERFQAVIDQADEITALAKADNSKRSDQPASVTPALDLTLAPDGKLIIRHRALETASLRLYSVDLEVLFSKDPFLKGEGNSGSYPSIRPNEQREVALAKDQSVTTIELPPAFRQGNVLIAAESANTKILKVLDSTAIEVRRDPAARSVQVLDSATGKPLPKTYVKVYAEAADGSIAFHKDGYTDLRGKFDYLSHTGIDPATVKRLALLISHRENGSRTVIYDR
ncbi:MAG: hypothetical protein NTW21_12080 [Verrucomicrobia bacterium]|nr:hypothetical protein [Verrucomicrobiota bacterium]